MDRIRVALRWCLVRGPITFYVVCEEEGNLPWRWLLLGLLAGCVAGGFGALIALLSGFDPGAGFGVGIFIVFGLLTTWLLYSLLFFGVRWALGQAPTRSWRHSVNHQNPGPEQEDAIAAYAAHWRRRGQDRLVPGGLVAFFAIVGVLLAAHGLAIRHSEGSPGGELTRAEGRILRWNDGRFGLQARILVVAVLVDGTPVTARMKAEDYDGDVPRPGHQINLEYPLGHPERARPAGTTANKKSDVSFDLGSATVCAVLCSLSAVGYTLGTYRQHRREQPPPAS